MIVLYSRLHYIIHVYVHYILNILTSSSMASALERNNRFLIFYSDITNLLLIQNLNLSSENKYQTLKFIKLVIYFKAS